jgi:hypothetical protein
LFTLVVKNKHGRGRQLALEFLEDRLTPATLLHSLYLPAEVSSQTVGHFGQSTATDSNLLVVGMTYADIGGFKDSGVAMFTVQRPSP